MRAINYTAVLLFTVTWAAFSNPLWAEVDHTAMHHATQPTASVAVTPASKAYLEANNRMHAAMTQPLTGDADYDFISGMVPHHQGAIDMAKIVLQYGKDPEVRKLAEAIIKAQEGEIAWMKGWQAKNQPK